MLMQAKAGSRMNSRGPALISLRLKKGSRMTPAIRLRKQGRTMGSMVTSFTRKGDRLHSTAAISTAAVPGILSINLPTDNS